MGISKVQYGNSVLVDLTSDTVAADKLLNGYTAHGANGEAITGTYAPSLSVKTITENGTYTAAADGTDGFSGVTVNVKSAGLVALDKTSVSIDLASTTASVNVIYATGAVSVESADTSIATATISNGVITITGVNGITGDTTITVTAAATSERLAATEIISVSVATVAKIYGAAWDGSSKTTWTRTDAAELFTEPVSATARREGSSPFDDIMPWAGMQISERTGGTMVSIPKFYYRLAQSGKGMTIQIANVATDGFSVSPAHADRDDGAGERDVVYVGRYHCAASTYKSATGASLQTTNLRSVFRTNIHNLGADIWQIDFATIFTIWLLYIVEYADWDSQSKIGHGCRPSAEKINTGYTDSMSYHTGTNATLTSNYGGTQYRNIEGLWDNCYDWLDGCYYNFGGLNIILDPSKFSDTENGAAVGKPSNGYPSAFTVKDIDGTFPLFIPTAASGSDSTYSCDEWEFYTTTQCLYTGGSTQGKSSGLFCVNSNRSTWQSDEVGSRIIELPSAA